MVHAGTLIVAESPELLHSIAHALIRDGYEVVDIPDRGAGPELVILSLAKEGRKPRRSKRS